jgi:hypothetical protein
MFKYSNTIKANIDEGVPFFDNIDCKDESNESLRFRSIKVKTIEKIKTS